MVGDFYMKQRTAYELRLSLVRSEMCISDMAITTRGPLVQYLLQELRVEPNARDMSARSQPIVVSNRKEISRWLFA